MRDDNDMTEGQPPAGAPQAIGGRIEGMGLYFVYPQGLADLDHPEASAFVVEVRYHGTLKNIDGGWSVSHGALSLLRPSVHTTPQWDLCRYDYLSQYRFDTFTDALSAARTVVDGVEVNGHTWKQSQGYLSR